MSGRHPDKAPDWTPSDERLLAKLVGAMRPFRSICAEFPGHSADIVLVALQRLISPGDLPIDRAIRVLGDRARVSRLSASGFTLDGRPAEGRQLVAAANGVINAYGGRAIFYPGGASS